MTLCLSRAAAAASERPAVIDASGALDYGQLARAAATLARRFDLARGARPLAVVGDTRRETIVLLHAAIASGRPVVMLHPRWSAREVRSALAQSGADEPLDLDDAIGDGAEPSLPAAPPDDERPLAIVFTSGTTGTPRGVVLSRRAFAAAARASAASLGLEGRDRWLIALPTAHVGGLSIVTRSLFAGASVALADPRDPGPDFARLAPTLASLVPTQLARLLARNEFRPPPSLRAALIGGAGAAPSLLAAAAERGVPALASYGMTETCAQVAAARLGHADPGVGPPLPGVQIAARHGVLWIRSPSLASGTLDGSPLPIEDGYLRSCDAGAVIDGFVHVHGRCDDVIVTGGENVHPLEVERALESLPDVDAACVVGLDDESLGQRVGALCVARRALSLDDLRRALHGELAAFKVPRTLACVPALPLTAAGKADRHRARAWLTGAEPISN